MSLIASPRYLWKAGLPPGPGQSQVLPLRMATCLRSSPWPSRCACSGSRQQRLHLGEAGTRIRLLLLERREWCGSTLTITPRGRCRVGIWEGESEEQAAPVISWSGSGPKSKMDRNYANANPFFDVEIFLKCLGYTMWKLTSSWFRKCNGAFEVLFLLLGSVYFWSWLAEN